MQVFAKMRVGLALSLCVAAAWTIVTAPMPASAEEAPAETVDVAISVPGMH